MSPRPARLLRQLGHFLLGSGLGLAVDLGLFYLAVRLGAQPWLANLLSAGCAVVVVYLFVTKYAFVGGRSRSSFLLFVGWYVTSIVIFSVLIDVLHAQTGWAPFICKLVSLPPSFAANFAASKLLFGRAEGDGAAPATRPAPARDGAGT
ncbi:GtrA family protein [Blastococcus saxobsidens]|uniref:Putative flippase GtrA n=1 Tax=Blastococcus saxobsidens TaxID=138336 RepID=A0A4Q7Y7X1_9ACTN|nr:GtrA family protein [Blastococcus saxobsidens]RZU33040.1 putative flippase GtrA [Blastococcus saxobsidens]